MTPEIRRFSELVAYIIILGMLLGSALYAFKLGTASDIFIGGIISAIVPVIQAVSRINQADAMNRLADHLARSSPAGKAQQVEVVNKTSSPIPVEETSNG